MRRFTEGMFSLWTPALGVVLVCLAGCGTQRVPVTDNNSSALALRAAIYTQTAARGEHSGPGIECGYEGYSAKAARTLALGELFSLGGVDLVGPDTLRQRATVGRVHVAYTHRLRYGPNFELEPFVGVARVELRYRAEPTNSALRPALNVAQTGVIGGITPRWRFNEWLALELRITGANGRRTDSFSSDAAVVLSPAPNLSLRLGFSEREQSARDEANTSWIEVRARGPSASLLFEF